MDSMDDSVDSMDGCFIQYGRSEDDSMISEDGCFIKCRCSVDSSVDSSLDSVDGHFF